MIGLFFFKNFNTLYFWEISRIFDDLRNIFWINWIFTIFVTVPKTRETNMQQSTPIMMMNLLNSMNTSSHYWCQLLQKMNIYYISAEQFHWFVYRRICQYCCYYYSWYCCCCCLICFRYSNGMRKMYLFIWSVEITISYHASIVGEKKQEIFVKIARKTHNQQQQQQ